ncbi:MAG: DUF2804 family protein [bacterium]
MDQEPLKLAPALLTTPCFGSYQGDSRWGFKPSFRQSLREKKWQWFGAFDATMAVGGAIVDVGYACKVFLWAYNRVEHRWWLDATRTLTPRAVVVADAAASGLVARGVGLSIHRNDNVWQISGEFEGCALDLTMTALAMPATAVCPTPAGWNVTRKQAALRCSGTISAGASHTFVDGWGLLDHSHGIMARETSWLWAMGGGATRDGEAIGFNAISGFNADLENFVWINDTVVALKRVTFEQGDVWRIHDESGALDLSLRVDATRSEALDLKLVRSDYVQPLGLWAGTIGGESVELYGVAENHRATW